MADRVREALDALASKWATGSSDDLADDTYQRAFNAARYRCAQELRAALASPSSESPAATGSGAATGPRDEAVFAFGVADGRGRRTGPAYDDRATAERVCREFNRDPADAFVDRVHPFTVVSLVPQRQQGGAR